MAEDLANTGGIACTRLAEERKAWRKDHPFVSFTSTSLGSQTNMFDFICRVSLLSLQKRLMAPLISWSGSVPFPEKQRYSFVMFSFSVVTLQLFLDYLGRWSIQAEDVVQKGLPKFAPKVSF